MSTLVLSKELTDVSWTHFDKTIEMLICNLISVKYNSVTVAQVEMSHEISHMTQWCQLHNNIKLFANII